MMTGITLHGRETDIPNLTSLAKQSEPRRREAEIRSIATASL